MSAVAVVRTLLVGDTTITATVAAASVLAGDLPLEHPLPAITIHSISSFPRLTVAMTEPRRMHTERVQVTVHVKSTAASPVGAGYPGLKTLQAALLEVLTNQRGTIGGVDVDSILPDSQGPDIQDSQVGIYSGSRDFIVKWRSPI